MLLGSIDKFLILVIGFFSLICFLTGKNITAFDFPATDMGAFLERFANQNFLPNDFFTNTSSLPNPRYIFGYFVAYLAKFFGVGWYEIFFFLKVFFIILNPILGYLMVISFFKKYFRDDFNMNDKQINNLNNHNSVLEDFFTIHLSKLCKFLTAGLIIYFLSNVNKFAVAWWPNIYFFVSAQTCSFFLAMLAIVIWNLNITNFWNFLAILFFILASLFHPSVGLCFFIFRIIFNFVLINDLSLKDFVFKTLREFILIIILPFLIIYLAFKPESTISTAEFIDIYVVQRHAGHYLFSKFESLDGNLWYFVFIKINLIFLATAIIGFIKKDRVIFQAGILAFLFYAGSIFLQYFFISVYPLKIIALIGPSRFTIAGFWMVICCILTIIVRSNDLICNYFKIVKQSLKNIELGYKYFKTVKKKLKKLEINHKCLKSLKILNLFFLKLSVKKLLLLGLLINFLTFKIFLDQPFIKVDRDTNGMVSWINNNIEDDAIFLTNDFQVEITLLCKKSTIASGFVFREDFFKESEQRDLLTKNFQKMSRAELLENKAKYHFNYLIFNKKLPHNFTKDKAIYSNEKFEIYKI